MKVSRSNVSNTESWKKGSNNFVKESSWIPSEHKQLNKRRKCFSGRRTRPAAIVSNAAQSSYTQRRTHSASPSFDPSLASPLDPTALSKTLAGIGGHKLKPKILLAVRYSAFTLRVQC